MASVSWKTASDGAKYVEVVFSRRGVRPFVMHFRHWGDACRFADQHEWKFYQHQDAYRAWRKWIYNACRQKRVLAADYTMRLMRTIGLPKIKEASSEVVSGEGERRLGVEQG